MFKDKICVVTGAASGIGLALSQELSKEDAKVVMVDVNEEILAQEAEKINQFYVQADLTKQEDNKKVIEKTVEKYGTVDVLINVAGIQHVETIEDFPEESGILLFR